MQPDDNPGGYPKIGDYALIGDCVAAALVSREGSVDWLCLPTFDSPSWFARLLDARHGGYASIRPAGRASCRRRYLPDTNVLETEFVCGGGVLRVTDCMTLADGVDPIEPQREVLRALESVAGAPEAEIVVEPRPDYARAPASFRRQGDHTWRCQRPGELLTVRSELPLHADADGRRLVGRARLQPGRRWFLSLSHSDRDVAVYPVLGEAAERRLQYTMRWWREWCSRSSYRGRYREQVQRSVLVMKLLDYARSGAVLAAPTTSLPEAIGGPRNWDYRYCWLRDASMTLRAFMDLGYRAEGEAFIGWLLHATWLTWPRLRVMYDAHGRPPPPEIALDHLEGYRRSRPVRIGNAARAQLQLDVYGEVILTAADYVQRGGQLDRSELRLLKGFGDEICRRWREPDHGMWEVRGRPKHYTYSKLMAWCALNALILLGERAGDAFDRRRLRRTMEEIRGAIERQGFRSDLGTYTAVFGEAEPDAALLKMPQYGYIGAGDPRMRGTFRFLRQRLTRNGLFYRYASGFDPEPASEASFALCSFWAVEYLAEAGRLDEARAMFEHILSFANDLGLLAEEIDPNTAELLGNFPQAFTHAGLIDAALSLERGVQRVEHAQEDQARSGRMQR